MPKWTTAYGRSLRPREMETPHILNSMAQIIRMTRQHMIEYDRNHRPGNAKPTQDFIISWLNRPSEHSSDIGSSRNMWKQFIQELDMRNIYSAPIPPEPFYWEHTWYHDRAAEDLNLATVSSAFLLYITSDIWRLNINTSNITSIPLWQVAVHELRMRSISMQGIKKEAEIKRESENPDIQKLRNAIDIWKHDGNIDIKDWDGWDPDIDEFGEFTGWPFP